MEVKEMAANKYTGTQTEKNLQEAFTVYEQYEAFDELEEAYLEMEEQVTALIASYVDDHLELFAKIIK